MKYLSVLLAVIGMAGCAFGQTVSAADFNCHNSTCTCAADGKSCAKPAPAPKKSAGHAKPVIKECSGLAGECEVESPKHVAQKPAKEVPCPPFGNGPCNWEAARKGRNLIAEWEQEKAKLVSGMICGTLNCIDPIDVPAIQETRQDEMNCHRNYIAGSPNDGWLFNKGMQSMCGDKPTFTTEWTCKDKTRGLWHDEQEPSKYWCRRVQP